MTLTGLLSFFADHPLAIGPRRWPRCCSAIVRLEHLDHPRVRVRAGDQEVRPRAAAGRLIALEGEAGYQARLLPPGWHFGLWRWQYSVVKVPLVVVRRARSRWWWPTTARPSRPSAILGREVECDHFQDAEAFLRHGGEKGRQLGILTAGTYRINPALFEVITPRNAEQYGMRPASCASIRCRRTRWASSPPLDGRPIPAGDIAGPVGRGPRQLPERPGASSTAAAAADCRSRSCSPARGT